MMKRHALRSTFMALVVGLAAVSSQPGGAAEQPATRPSSSSFGFRDNVKVEVTDELLIVRSDGIPDHETGQFPNRRNPNTIRKQDYTFRIPRHPKPADKVGRLPMGPIGVALNGVPFYNPYNREGEDAALNEVFDECCGHPDPLGRYHYHIYPKCQKTPFAKDDPSKHSPLIGYAFDGYGVFGPLGDGGKRPTDLDECNGHTDAERGYHYHVTDRFPYILGGYHGVVERGNFDGPGRRAGPIRGPGRGPRRGAPPL